MLNCVWALFVHVVSLFAPLVGLDIGESVKGLGFLFSWMLNTLRMVTCIHIMSLMSQKVLSGNISNQENLPLSILQTNKKIRDF